MEYIFAHKLNVGVFRIIVIAPRNIVMDLNNVMSDYGPQYGFVKHFILIMCSIS